MSDFLLLQNAGQCPACRALIVFRLPGCCRRCGKQLFKATDNLQKFEEDTGLREYWVWTGTSEGWKHRSHIFDPKTHPLEREYRPPKLPDDYGTPAFTQRQISETRSELKAALKKPRLKRILKLQRKPKG